MTADYDECTTAEDLRRLLEIALWAASHGRLADARTICDGVRSVRPLDVEPALASAFIDLAADRLASAAKTLEPVVARQPASEIAKAMLAVVKSRQGLAHEARKWADDASRSSDRHAAAVVAEFFSRGVHL